MNTTHFQKLFEYNYWAHRIVWDCVLKLSDEQYYRPCDYSIGSVHNQVAHTYAGEYLWLGRVRQDPLPRFPALDEYPDRVSLRAAWDELEREWRGFVNQLDDQALAESLEYVSINGNRKRTTPLWEMLTQILNHGTDHRAQTLALIHQVGGETLEQDFIFYSWEVD
jgi:uncharacterized damage-inducible protein DinB